MLSAIARTAARNARASELALSGARRKRRGPEPMPACQRRTHAVSVRLNGDELRKLDAQRTAAGDQKRGEQLRQVWLGKAPEVGIPEANRLAYAALARTSANLTQIAARLSAGYSETRHVINEAAYLLAAFRASLLTPLPFEGRAAECPDLRLAEAAGRLDRKARRGPNRLPAGELRDHVVAVRLSVAELDELDRQCRAGEAMRGEWLRMSWVELTPASRIRRISDSAYEALAMSAATINSVARHLNEGGEVQGRISLIDEELAALRRNLQRAESSKE